MAEPVIKLDPSGKAPTISYNVPEPTSYTGRNYIDLQYPADHFVREVPAVAGEGEASASRTSASELALRMPSLGPGHPASGEELLAQALAQAPAGVRLVDNGDKELTIESDEPISPRLKQLGPGQVSAFARSGRHVKLCRSLSGALTYRLVPANGSAAPAPAAIGAQRVLGDGRDPIVVVFVVIYTPAQGDTITGPTSGVTFVVEGGAEAEPGGVDKVELRVDGGSFEPTEAVWDGGQYTWKSSVSLTTSGSHTITARAVASGKTATHSITVTAVLSTPDNPDSTPPEVSITTPAEGTVVTVQSLPVSVNLSGTASDADSGVKSVDVRVENDPATAVSVTPDAEGLWATALTLGTAGDHVLMARAVDNAGNERQRRIGVRVAVKAPSVPIVRRLLLVEINGLSSYLGSYGAGRVLKTFTLLPGEKTKIGIKTYTRSSTTSRNASSIVDSLTDESADSFEQALGDEQTAKEGYAESFNYEVTGEAQAAWGWGSAKVTGKVSGGANASREELTKRISNVLQKHAMKSSAQRNMEVKAETEVKVEAGEETAIERQIENINVGRTLNFVFRQMNQEFISCVHLLDVRVGYYKEDLVDGAIERTYREAALPELDSLLSDAVVPSKRDRVKEDIFNLLSSIPDHTDSLRSIVEYVVPQDADGVENPEAAYLRVKKGLTSTYSDPVTGSTFVIPGIILDVTGNVLRTDGVIVETILGQGEGLDSYSRGLQETAVKEAQAKNALTEAEVDRTRLAQQLVSAKNTEAAKLYAQVFPCCPDRETVIKVGSDDAQRK